jgi:hypothetical protein
MDEGEQGMGKLARRVAWRRENAAFWRTEADRLEAEAADARARADRLDAAADQLLAEQ